MGFFSGGHCVGMCGPLVLALPVDGQRVAVSVIYRVVYNVGRITTYMALGGVAGLVALFFYLPFMQARVAQVTGILLIGVAVLQLLPHFRLAFFARVHSNAAKWIAPWMRNAGHGRFFLLGMLNGLLPCGMVASALVVSIAAQDWVSGVGYMLAFGAGTFPLMLLASVFGVYLSGRTRRLIGWLGPLYAIGLGVLLLVRPSLVAPHCVQ